jgi:hypothetical protein
MCVCIFEGKYINVACRIALKKLFSKRGHAGPRGRTASHPMVEGDHQTRAGQREPRPPDRGSKHRAQTLADAPSSSSSRFFPPACRCHGAALSLQHSSAGSGPPRFTAGGLSASHLSGTYLRSRSIDPPIGFLY